VDGTWLLLVQVKTANDSDGVSRLGLGLESRRVSRPVFWSLGLEGFRSRLGLELFVSRLCIG